jgi:hypothetical protein
MANNHLISGTKITTNITRDVCVKLTTNIFAFLFSSAITNIMNHTTMEVPTLSQTLNIWQIIILFSMVGIIYIGMSKIANNCLVGKLIFDIPI